MNKKWLATLGIALLPTLWVVPQSVAATPSCIGPDCEITFSYTGEYQTWSPPPGIKDLSFEIYGAAGGRGGAGGNVSGLFTDVPETLYIFVGGAGGMGNGIGGGFNGGGAAGGNSGTEGAGGGATDIRLGLDLDSRIVVAGGAGGGGGEAGGNGGHGGNDTAMAGGNGQAPGGGGGSQTSGGIAGINNGGFAVATPGTLGVGGNGGFSTFAGGGGGGGGYYGGGGGGADDNTCCSDGGGGGGGSSFINTNYVSQFQQQAGVSWGHGWVTFRYTVVPIITYFEMIQVNSERAVFTLEASENLIGLEQSALTLIGAGCELSEFEIDGSLAFGAVTGCESGELSLTLAAESFGQSVLGPVEPEVASLNFDATAPTFEFTTQSFQSSQSDQVIQFLVSDQLQLVESMFSVSGCDGLQVQGSQLSLSSCSEGVATVALLEYTLSDNWQNMGPAEPISLSFTIDQTPPTATWSEVAISGSNPFSYSATLDFSEPVSISNMALAFAASSDCEAQSELQPQRLLVWSSCGYASVQWSFAGQVFDAAGNQMQHLGLSAAVSHPEPVVIAAPAPTPAPQPAPVTPAPVVEAPVPEPAVSESPEAEVIAQPETTSERAITDPEPEPTRDPDAVPTSAPNTAGVTVQPQSERATVAEAAETLEALEPEVTQLQPEVIELPVQQEEVISQPVLGEELLSEEPAFPWWPVALMLAVGALGVGAWRLSGR